MYTYKEAAEGNTKYSQDLLPVSFISDVLMQSVFVSTRRSALVHDCELGYGQDLDFIDFLMMPTIQCRTAH